MSNPTKKAVNSQLLAEVLDPNKVTLVCEIHNYVAGSGARRNLGCKKCIMVDYIYMIAKTPPEKRAETLDRFEALVKAMCELEDEGQLDVQIYDRPQIEIEWEDGHGPEVLKN
jgi:hypothetical protein